MNTNDNEIKEDKDDDESFLAGIQMARDNDSLALPQASVCCCKGAA